ncbi:MULTISPECIES: helix-turn-helix transcriptional regulator [unclassified Pseudoclavibacter]|uniref:helix-turn-helix transcriptional regulator n=1 Tax=unclassified Pseudoclavibacter TaxID=2615177 RepID=UPI001BA78843|nr:helix-turn-helix transcriptional regulator [Pseudoclavibacter sp. Marseille-Q4354]MBS3179345.1 helix-turn-helix domain-containing protein [Pseudoclavibacter sp. Marseille-Q4354]
MDNRSEVREFISSRRGRLPPEQAGIDPGTTRRRVTGLRRDEVARLAGVSVEYYTRVDRGNLTGVSDNVLDAVARALQLSRAEHDHLRDLARTANLGAQVRPAKPRATGLGPTAQHLLDSITGAAAIIGNNRMDIVAANDLGFALYSEMYRSSARPANHARFIFLDPRAHDLYPDWERAANVNVEILRREAGRSPFDKQLTDLVGELSVRSGEFRTRWAAHDVRRHYSGAKQFQHPVVGLLELNYHAMDLEDDPGHTMTVYTPLPASPSEEGLRLLSSWAATENISAITRDPAVRRSTARA